MTRLAKQSFRPDIQGLRAIAVVLVILAHAGVPWLAGGFVGVDVFFVLSGFLITGLLLQEKAATGRLSFGAFYLRRLRRLLPALLVVIGATVLTVGWLLPPLEGRPVLASLPFASTWTSNLFFVLREQDYFNELGARDLFLHTWSLGAEEQFYLLWPVLLLGLIAATRVLSLRQSLLLLVGVSLVASVTWTHWYPISAFYLMPARIWQFGLGGLVYLQADVWEARDEPVAPILARGLLAMGLLLIMGAALLLRPNMTYPGLWALLPSLGAALVILAGSAGRHEAVGQLGLRHPLLVWVGDRSYSLYLWHWPIIVLLSLSGVEVGLGHRGLWLALLLTLLLAMLSYRWVELPFWKGGLRRVSARHFLLGASASVLLVLAVNFHVQRVPFDAEAASVAAATAIRTDLPVIYRLPCDAWYRDAKVEPCVFGAEDAPETAVLLADSVGAQWFSAWAEIFRPPRWRLVVLTKSACPLVDEDYFYPRIGKIYAVCREWRDAVLKQIASFNPKVIVVGNAATYDFTPEQWVQGSLRVLASLREDAPRVIVVSGTPVLGFDGPGCIARELAAGRRPSTDDCLGKPDATARFHQVAAYLSEAASTFDNVEVINPVDLVCPGGRCRAISSSGIPVFRDSQHLTDTFVRSNVMNLRGLILDFANEGR